MATSASGTRRRIGRVLIIDDERDLARVLARALSRDYEVVVLHEAEEALLRLTAGERYDVLLCDVMMPSMSGVELHQRLTATVPDQASRIVFMSGGGFTEAIAAFLRQAPNLLIEKPVDLEGLRGVVERRVQGSRGPLSDVGS